MKKIYLSLFMLCMSFTNVIAQTCTINLSSAVGTNAQSVCVNVPISDITYTTNSTGAIVVNLPAGVNGVFAAGVFTISGTPTVSGTFNYTITSSGGCAPDAYEAGRITVNTDDASFNYNPSTICKVGGVDPTPTITGLAGGVFSATGGITMDANTGVVDLATTAVGTYTITYTISGACISSSTATINILNAPDASFSYAGPFCINESNPTPTFPLGSSGGNFSATPAGLDFTNSAPGEVNLAASAAGSYTVTNTIASGGSCPTTTYSNTIEINASPNVTVNSVTICEGESATLTAVGATSYAWSNGSVTSSITVSPTTTTSYTVTGTTAGCSAQVVGTVTISTIPTVSMADAIICEGSTATLTARGATTYAWSDGSVTPTKTVTPKATTTYTVTGTTAGCFGSAVATVTVSPSPIVTVTSAGICKGDSAVLAAAGAASYIWSTVNAGSTLMVAPITSTTYTVTGAAGGCTARAVATVIVSDKPILETGKKDIQTVCINHPIQDIVYGVYSNYTTLGLPAGVTATLQSNKVTISGTPTVEGTFTYTLSANNPKCNLPSTLIGNITVKPLSTASNNIGGCDGFLTIKGNVFQDLNNNCTLDTAIDQKAYNIPLKLYDGNNNLVGQTYTQSGAYTFSIWDTAGTYTVKVDSNSLYTSQCGSGNTNSVTFTALIPQVINVNFSQKCSSELDYGVRSITTRGRVFPGQRHSLNINAGIINSWYNLDCSETNSGTLTVTVTGPVTFNSVYPGALTPTINGNEYSYTIADWSTVDMFTDFKLYFDTKTTAQSFDKICIHAELIAAISDNNITNNSYDFCYRIRNSYDPNLKEVYPIDVEPAFEDWLNYTIHFQNTGDANAINISLKDTLDANLNLESFEVLGYSHPCTVTLYENLLTIFYANIELPDSASNPEGSQGSFQYRIKPVSNLPLGTKINNTASIYFDYNAPIVTNTTVNEYKSITNISGNNNGSFVRIFPNPFGASLQIELDKAANISIRNLLGSVVYSGSLAAGTSTIETSSLSAGIYFISIENGEGVSTEKLIKN